MLSFARLAALVAAGALAAPGCIPDSKKSKKKTDDPNAVDPAGTPPTCTGLTCPERRVVLVLDDGFDVDDTVFKDKILAKYTVKCDATSGASAPQPTDAATDLATAKAKALAAYKSPSSTCTISDGLTFKVGADFAAIVPQRDAWNTGVEQKKLAVSKDDALKILTALEGADVGGYHGTSTAGLIAYQNTDVALVLMQYDLGEASDPVVKNKADCPTQDEINLWVQVHQDAEVAKAYVEQPLDDTSSKLYEIIKKHAVSLVNLSLGTRPRAVLEAELAKEGCGTLDFGAYFKLKASLDAQQTTFDNARGDTKDANPLSIQSAGNDGVELKSPDDGSACSDHANNEIVVGAVNAKGNRSDFSNYGKCVDFFALGESVVAPAPQNFLNIVDGTSFSAPLTVRFITTTFDKGVSATDLITQLTAHVDASGRLTNAAPHELAFDDTTAITGYALTGEAGRAPAPLRPLPSFSRWGRLAPALGF